MIKSTNSIYQLDYPAKSTLTPIRDSREAFFPNRGSSAYKNGSQLRETLPFNPYAKSMWTSECHYKASAKYPVAAKTHSIHTKPPKSRGFQRSASILISSTEPLNLDFEKAPTKPASTSEFVGKKFFDAFYDFLGREEDYAYMTDMLNMIYRKELHHKKASGKLMAQSSNEEILLFGNMDTISQLSRILVKSLRNYVSSCCKSGTACARWSGPDASFEIPESFAEHFDPAEFFESHLSKIRSTYSTYFLSHRRQLELLEHLKKTKSTLFYRWYESCLDKADLVKIEDIIAAPVKRLGEFYKDILNIIREGEDFLSGSALEKLRMFADKFHSFLSTAETLLDEGAVAKEQAPFDSRSSNISNHLTVPLEGNSCRSSETHLSLSSSRYSDHLSVGDMDAAVISSHVKLNEAENEDPTLADYISRFKQVGKHMEKLEKELSDLDIAAILDQNMRQAEEWRKIFEFEPLSQLLTEQPNVESIYTIYINKLHQQRQEVMLTKLGDLQEKVIAPLTLAKQSSKMIQSKIQDLKELKKDYMSFLGSKDARSIKFKLIANHFQSTQRELLDGIPKYLDLISQFTILLMRSYNQIMMKYMEILSGGKRLLTRELQMLEKGEREQGDNFDILQSFASSRFYTKQLIHENWNCHGRAVESRVVRKLFEI
ncbi:Fus2p [Lachancea thermotolerans CBS 6340]|uniref:KLTH0E04290p n=1 Tax=Lachancea thermotolerans (strain ATCC 56472 / CBS 6340 / NRRL Y-8284) TaxID=559295 RepID=C5DHH1_LACTC|nr:KLTH0E04290p [Lachancea thermotolerans CBS 6340]CAR23232.1 KLTH0E04290p [Lachancea thermotolerans CBS 6340]